MGTANIDAISSPWCSASTPTKAGGTMTSRGWIPHLRHPVTGVYMPVKVRVNVRAAVGAIYPAIDAPRGWLNFVLPGGKTYESTQPLADHRISRGQVVAEGAQHG